METTLVLRWSGVFPDLWGLYGNSISMSLRLYNHILCYNLIKAFSFSWDDQTEVTPSQTKHPLCRKALCLFNSSYIQILSSCCITWRVFNTYLLTFLFLVLPANFVHVMFVKRSNKRHNAEKFIWGNSNNVSPLFIRENVLQGELSQPLCWHLSPEPRLVTCNTPAALHYRPLPSSEMGPVVIFHAHLPSQEWSGSSVQ